MSESLIPDLFFERAREHPSRVAFGDLIESPDGAVPSWAVADWQTYAGEVSKVARAMIALDVAVGERVAILGSNRSEWTISDLAAMSIGAVPLGIYSTCPHEQVAYVLRHSGATVVVVEDELQLEKVRAVRDRLPELRKVITMKAARRFDDVIHWEELADLGAGVDAEEPARRRAGVTTEDLATLVYTSGTTGTPKAVMLSHGNLLAATGMGLEALTEMRDDDAVLSYLPLAHVAERGISVLGPSAAGYCVYFCPRIELMPAALRTARPTIFLGVPRVWEKVYHVINSKSEESALRRRLLKWALSAGAGNKGISSLLADRLVLGRIRTALGLDRAHTVACGAAPMSDDILDFFSAVGIEIRKIYGLSECSGPATFNRPGEDSRGNVGRPFTDCEVKIGPGDEILIRGPNLFMGYFKSPEETAEVFDGDWLRSGDLGRLNRDGSLTITGRRRDIIITSGGKNIAPQHLEGALGRHPTVEAAIVVGDGRPYLSALICPANPRPDESSLSQIAAHVQRVNESVSRVEQIKTFTILKGSFTVEGGELTPTRKLRRSAIYEKFASEIEEMYSGVSGTKGAIAVGASTEVKG
ncbi:MAG: long-chain fatty acid--CoA ligase [Rhodothermia bacterium]|nr:long-chain fatty acid--CoA ligase [Rhodothermia bacterium]